MLLPLSKAISSIPKGTLVGSNDHEDSYSYNHILKPEHLKDGFELHVLHRKNQSPQIGAHFKTILSHNGKQIGYVSGIHDKFNNSIEPHSELDVRYHGKGLGTAMYEAMLAYVKHNGIGKVRGIFHSKEAARVHNSLKNKHGIDYKPDEGLPGGGGYGFDHGPYEYIIKSEEVARLLNHPNISENKLALKMEGVTSDNLIQALKIPLLEIHEMVFSHPMLDFNVLDDYLKTPPSIIFPEIDGKLLYNDRFDDKLHLDSYIDRLAKLPNNDVQVTNICNKPNLSPEMYEKLWNMFPVKHENLLSNLNVPVAFIICKLSTPNLNSEDRRLLLTHPKLPEDSLKNILDGNIVYDWQTASDLVSACRNPNISAELITEMFKDKAWPSSGSSNDKYDNQCLIRTMLTSHPNFNEAHAYMAMHDLNANVRKAIFKPIYSKPIKLSDKLIDTGLKDADPGVRELALKYKEKLHKNEYNVEPFLDHDLEKDKIFAAAKFMASNPEISENCIEDAIRECDGNYEEAALMAYGLEINEANLETLQLILNINEKFNKSEEDLNNLEVKTVYPEGQNFVDIIKEAALCDEVKPINLKGKHVKDSLLANDKSTGMRLLLKPGFGKNSPVRGTREEQASQSQREAGASQLAKIFGLEQYVPEVQLVNLNNKQYAAIKMFPEDYVTGDKMRKEHDFLLRSAMFKYLNEGLLHKWAIFHYIIGDGDAHGNNVLINEKGAVRLIDHGSAFANEQFDPGHDSKAFIPFYLRSWTSKGFSKLSPEEKLKYLPTINRQKSDELKEWVNSINYSDIVKVLVRYGINPRPTIERLAKIKDYSNMMDISELINKLWLGLIR